MYQALSIKNNSVDLISINMVTISKKVGKPA